MLLIKNVKIYEPKFLGKKDILICGEKIEVIDDQINIFYDKLNYTEINGDGLFATPGFIDQHVHVIGGGGEGGFHTRTPEIIFSDFIKSGITTTVGLLGTDDITRNVENLYAKILALNEEGITAYMLTGAYGYPSPTITDSIKKDIIFIKEILGLKLAVSDHRAPNITLEQLIKIASDVRVAGMLSGKAGILTLHMGDAKSGLTSIFEVLKKTAIPITTIRPTHINRNKNLLEEGFEFLKLGGFVDYTCKISKEFSPGNCILEAKKKGISTSRITFSSDGQGSWSKYDEDGKLIKMGISKISNLYDEWKVMIKDLKFSIEEALTYITSNVAVALKIDDKKGFIKENFDADILLFDKNLQLNTVISKGKIMMKNEILLNKGTYEK